MVTSRRWADRRVSVASAFGNIVVAVALAVLIQRRSDSWIAAVLVGVFVGALGLFFDVIEDRLWGSKRRGEVAAEERRDLT